MYEVDDIMSIDFGKSEIGVKTLFFERTNCYDFDDIVLMQSTGLTDKNGKEIFEGDVVKMAKNVYSEPTYYEVVRHRGGAYRLESKQYGCELWLRHTDCEIAGDIYENPELVEVSS
ncbi:hypothetical protein Ssal_phage00038 [Streptococcus phage YMC-2011]|uniref:hypothetical protein n=1 Tax=Streptococcus phage YMC-2011 TaxID=1051631 RepID=UPI000217A933|nr:hypothetical protein Ssal_phage00038 [Streptococcus phage YMC-2011]AEJ54401.1 conserved hypothetical protein [Streptococcus phage YMC-2011]